MLRFAQRSILRAALALLAVANLLDPPPARAQHLGDVSLTTTTQLLASSVSCTGNPQNFPVSNLGQNFHLATAVSTAVSFAMEIDGTDAAANVFRISTPQISVGTSAFLVQGVGFLPIVSVNLTCTLGSTFSLSYSGSFASGSLSVGTAGSGSIPSTTGGNVQGIVATGVNAFPIFPIVLGGLQPAVNASFNTLGVDNFNATSLPEVSGFTGNLTFASPPAPAKAGEGAIAFFTGPNSVAGTGLLAPWSCVTASCGSGGNSLNAATVNNVTTATSMVENQVNSNVGTWQTVIVDFAKLPTVRQQNFASAVTISTPGNTLAGSTLMVAIECTNFPCLIDSNSDGQGNKWTQVASLQNTNASTSPPGGINVWIAGPSSAAAETVTPVAHAGTTISNMGIVELTSITPAALNTPNLGLFASNRTALPNEVDNGGLFTESGGFSYSQTVTLTASNTFPLWNQSQHGLFQSCTLGLRVTGATGTTPTLNTFLQDSPDGVGFNDHLSMPQATAAGNFEGVVPLFTAANLTATASGAVATTNQVLAAGSAIAGPMGPIGRIAFVLGGTTPSFTITFNVSCK